MKTDDRRPHVHEHGKHVRVIIEAAVDRLQPGGRGCPKLAKSGLSHASHACSRAGSIWGAACTNRLTLKGAAVCWRIWQIISRARTGPAAPTPIAPSAPACDTAAARADVDTPAMGAWSNGISRPIRANQSIGLIPRYSLVFTIPDNKPSGAACHSGSCHHVCGLSPDAIYHCGMPAPAPHATGAGAGLLSWL